MTRQTAWGCFTANLALPGSGSLVAGRISGYPQFALAAIGMFLTSIYGVRFVSWYIANWSRITSPQGDDPFASMGEVWQMVRLPLAGIGIFGIGWIWGFLTGLSIVRQAKESPASPVPPLLKNHPPS